jgi:hypothetical protein
MQAWEVISLEKEGEIVSSHQQANSAALSKYLNEEGNASCIESCKKMIWHRAMLGLEIDSHN